MKSAPGRLFGPVMFWTATTTIFAWLPLVRIAGRAEDYEWGVMGLGGEATEGPFWIFSLLTIYAIALLFTAFRGPRALFYPMLIVWHLVFTTVILAAAFTGGSDATFQGQGLHWSFPLWVVALPCVAFTGLSIAWVVADHRHGGAPTAEPWSRANTRRLLASVALLLLALVFFRAGTNYNWVTALAIVVTILHWILMVRAFEPAKSAPASS